jgi:hypothetical protein
LAAISGKGGTVYLGSVPVLRVNGWSLDVNTNMLEVTSFSTSSVTWREYTPGLNDASGSINGFWDIGGGSTAQKDLQDNIFTPASATLVLEADQTNGGKYSGTAFLSRQSVNADIDGTVDASWDIQYSGAVTFSTTT